MTILYDPEHHAYSRADTGASLISVTQVLKEGLLGDELAAQYFTEEGRERGTRIHAALAAWHFGASLRLKPDDLPYWMQIERFLTDGGFQSESSEVVVADGRLGYAGTYDIYGKLAKFPLGYDLIDVKLNHVPRTVGAQTMAYRMCLAAPEVRRWALKVTATTYRLVGLNVDPQTGRLDLLQDMRDKGLFLQGLGVATFRRSFAKQPYYPEA